MSGKEINSLITTGELAKADIAKDKNKAAEAFAESRIEQLNEDYQKRKKRLIKLGAMITLTVLILIFTTIAWFSMNDSVSAGSMAVTTSTLPFELATKGTLVRYQTEFSSVNGSYNEGQSGSFSNPSGTTETYYTSENTDSLMIRFVPSNATDNPETDYDDRYLPDIEPGSCGTLSLYVIPKETENLSINFSFNIIGYVNAEVYSLDSEGHKIKVIDEETEAPAVDENGNFIYETETKLVCVSDLSTSISTMSQEDIDAIKQAETYLNSHIMFFGAESSSPSTYYYSDPRTYKSLTFDNGGNEMVADTAYHVPIYWMWVNTFGQIALKDNTSTLRGTNIPIVQDSNAASGTDKAKVIKYLKDNKSTLFYDLEKIAALTDEQKNGKTNDQIADLIGSTVDTMITNADAKANFDALSIGYNDADYEIGTRLNYFIIEVKAECN